MPPLALRYVRTAFAFLIYGMMIGWHVSAALHLGWGSYRIEYRPAHAHVILVGFLLMLIMGLALWRFPEPAPGTRAWIPRGAWWGLTLAVLARSTCEVLSAYWGWRWLGAAIFAASGVQLLAVWAFGVHVLARVRAASGTT